MFGLLMGTLQKFKQESNVSTEKVRKSVLMSGLVELTAIQEDGQSK